MKKTLHINLNGFAFNMDEDAHQALETYLNKVENSFADKAEAQEIVADIEARFAELFQNSNSATGRVISLSEVKEVIKTMGEPQEFADEDAGTERPPQEPIQEDIPNYRKRLYRDPGNKVFGGVCGGLGSYFDMDPLVFRVIFFLAFVLYGASLPVYLILWIVMPKALTLTQRMEMKGPSNYEKWEQNLRSEYQDVSTRFKQSKAYENVNTGASRASDVMSVTLRKLVNFIVVAFGAILMSATLIGLVGIITAFVFGFSFLDFSGVGSYYASIPDLFMSGGDFTYASIGIVLLSAMPLVILFFLGFKLAFKVKARSGYIILFAFVFWLVGLVMVVFTAGKVAKSYASTETVYSKDQLPEPSVNTLYIMPNGTQNLPMDEEKLFEMNQLEVYAASDQLFVKGSPTIELLRGDDFSININRKARGGDMKSALENAEGIEYFWLLKDSVLYIDPVFTLQDGIKVKDQQVDVTITIPQDIEVDIEGNLAWSIHNNLD